MKKIVISLFFILLFYSIVSADTVLTINCSPQGAAVYYDGKLIGNTPLVISPSTPNAPAFFQNPNKSYDLFVAYDFFETETITVSYNGENSEYSVSLVPIPRLPFYDGSLLNMRIYRPQDLFFMDIEALAKLKEELFARYGRPIQDKRFVSWFNNTRWYRENPLYSESMLSGIDRMNLKQINDFLEENPKDLALFKAIIKQYEFFNSDKTYSIRFINAKECILSYHKQNNASSEIFVPYFINELSSPNFTYTVAASRIYIADEHKDFFCEIILNTETKQLVALNVIADLTDSSWNGW